MLKNTAGEVLQFGRWTVTIDADDGHFTAVKYVTGSDVAVRSQDFRTIAGARAWASRVAS